MKKLHLRLFYFLLLIGFNLILTFSNSFSIDWYKVYNTKWENGITPSNTLPWSETYTLRSYISMYRASKARNEADTEQIKWIDRLIEHCDYIVNSPAMEAEGKAYLVYAGHGFTPLANVVNLIFSDDKLYSVYGAKANAYLSYIEQKIIPYWRNYDFKETPFNWFLSYGSLLLYLHRVSVSKYYGSSYYNTPDSTLKDYYLSFVSDIATNYFNDYHDWVYSGAGWNDAPFPLKKGLCYYPVNDSYLWRYFDYTGSLTFWGYKGVSDYQGVETSTQLDLNKWYKMEMNFRNDSLIMNVFDEDGTTLVTQLQAPWVMTDTKSDLVIGKRVDGDEYFNGIIDEVKFFKDTYLVASWRMEGNADDSSGNNLNGVIHGAPEKVVGRYGYAYKFQTGDYITVPNNTIFDNINRIELWVNFNELNTGRYYILGRGEHFQYGPGGMHLFMDCYKRPEDVGHANIDIEFLVNAVNDLHFKSAYPDSLMHRFCNTFTKDIWSNSDTLHPAFRSHIDPVSDYGVPDYDEHTIRWLWLYQYNPFIGTLISNWYEAHPDDQNLSEAVANLACWQAGVTATDNEITGIEGDGSISMNDFSLSVYPNPANNYLSIAFTKSNLLNTSISIYNSHGVEIKRINEKELSGQNSLSISIVDFPSGVYYCTMNTGTERITKRFVVVR
jgi:hypothetical protein